MSFLQNNVYINGIQPGFSNIENNGLGRFYHCHRRGLEPFIKHNWPLKETKFRLSQRRKYISFGPGQKIESNPHFVAISEGQKPVTKTNGLSTRRVVVMLDCIAPMSRVKKLSTIQEVNFSFFLCFSALATAIADLISYP